MKYVLDTDVFIQAKNRHYGFEFCPAFWDWLIEANEIELVVSVEQVLEELLKRNDDLADWARERSESFFSIPDSRLSAALNRINEWAHTSRYRPTAVTSFLAKADFWLVTYGLAHNCTVVTHEVRANTVKKIKIPNVCDAFGVPCMLPFEMLRREGARFVNETRGNPS